MYTAIIRKVSEVDQVGQFEVVFDVFQDDTLLFENIVRRGVERDVVVQEIQMYLKEVSQRYVEKNKFEIGEVISI